VTVGSVSGSVGRGARIAHVGDADAATRQLCREHYGDLEALACASLEDVFAAVEGAPAAEPTAELAIIPIDSSTSGRVLDTHHLLAGSGLHIVAEHFRRAPEELADNVEATNHTTRFVVLSRELREAPADGGSVVTSLVFDIRNLPGALYKALGGFATNGVNMTKLESYMVGGRFHATRFLAEIDGHPRDRGVANALKELSYFTTGVNILGVYPADPFRGELAFQLSEAPRRVQ
jgi:prephenate dehydratase